MGDTAQYYEPCAIVLPLPCYSACVYIPFMFQQCDKRYTDVFQAVSRRLYGSGFHNNLIFKINAAFNSAPLLFRVGGLIAIGPTSLEVYAGKY